MKKHFLLNLSNLFILLYIFSILSCSKGGADKPDIEKSSAKQLISFGFLATENNVLTSNISGVISGNNVIVNVPPECNLKTLVATFSSSPKSVVKIGSVNQIDRVTVNDFSSTVIYSVYAEDGSMANYSVTVTKAKSAAKNLTKFVFEKSLNQSLPYDIICAVNEVSKKISVTFPSSVSSKQLIATFIVSDKAFVKINGITQTSGVTSANYASNMNISVYAEDGSSVDYLYEPANEQLPAINISLLTSKIQALNYFRRGPNPAYFVLPDLVPILSSTYNTSKPGESFNFDCGYIGGDNKIYISHPLTPEQKAVFSDVNSAALYYVCKAFIHHYFNNSQMPCWFDNGFAAYESGIRPEDSVITSSIKSMGGSIPHLNELSDRNRYESKGGIFVSYLFGEMMSVYLCWPYFDIISTSSSGITVGPWRFTDFNTFEAKWLRYADYRILKTENSRLKWQKETTNFKPIYRDVDASINYPYFTDNIEAAYLQYKGFFNISYPQKLTLITMPEKDFAYIDGVTPDGRITGGTAWPSGVSSTCAVKSEDINYFKNHLWHELAHEFQSIIMKPGISMPAWLNEGFPSFMAEGGMMTASVKQERKSDVVKAMNDAIAYFSHKPTYNDIAVYPNPYFNYYLLGQVMYEFIYEKGGYAAVKAVTADPVSGFATIGYSTPDAFMNAYHAYFDSKWR